MLRALSAVPVAAGLAAGAVLLVDAGGPWLVLGVVLPPVGAAGISLAYSRGRVSVYPMYGGVAVLVAGMAGGFWQEGRDVETNHFLVGFILVGGWTLGGVVVGGSGLDLWRTVKRAGGGRR